jgi:hypothetical protein
MAVSTINGVPIANVASINGAPIANIKSWSGVELQAGPAPGIPLAPTNLIAAPYEEADVAQIPKPENIANIFSAPHYAFSGEMDLRVDFSASTIDSTLQALFTKRGGTSSWQHAFGLFVYTSPFRLYFVGGGNNNFTGLTLPTIGEYQRVIARVQCNASGIQLSASYDRGKTWVDGGYWSGNGLIVNDSAQFQIFRERANSRPFKGGDVYRAIIWNSYEGTGKPMIDFNPTDASSYGTGVSWIADSLAGETWTAEGAAEVKAVNTLLFDSFTDSDNVDLENHRPEVGGPWLGVTENNIPSVQENRLSHLNDVSAFPPDKLLTSAYADLMASFDFRYLHQKDNARHAAIHLLFRYDDDQNYWRLSIDSSSATDWAYTSIIETTADTDTQRATASTDPNLLDAVGSFQLVTRGDRISTTTYYGSALVSLTHSSAVRNTSPTYGLRMTVDASGGALGGIPWIDNYRVYTITDARIPVVKPTVDAGGPYNAFAGEAVQLAGSVTPGSDPDPAPYQWEIVSGGTGSFSDSGALDTTFTPDSAGTYTLRLTAQTDDAGSVSDTATVESVLLAVHFEDTFTDADSTLLSAHTPDTGGPWVNDVAGGWPALILSNELTSDVGDVSGNLGTWTVETGASDVTVSHWLYYYSGNANNRHNTIATYFRYVDTNNHWRARVTYSGGSGGVFADLRETTGGSDNLRGSTVITRSSGEGTMVIKANGDQIDVELTYIGVLETISFTSSVHNTATKCGTALSSDASGGAVGGIPRIDNFKVTDYVP